VLENGHDEFMGVEAKLMLKEESNARLLSKGDEVAVVCQGGTMIVITSILENCYLTQAAEQPTDATERTPDKSGAWVSGMTTVLPANTKSPPGSGGFHWCNGKVVMLPSDEQGLTQSHGFHGRRQIGREPLLPCLSAVSWGAITLPGSSV
jgi:hypothetical protein